MLVYNELYDRNEMTVGSKYHFDLIIEVTQSVALCDVSAEWMIIFLHA